MLAAYKSCLNLNTRIEYTSPVTLCVANPTSMSPSVVFIPAKIGVLHSLTGNLHALLGQETRRFMYITDLNVQMFVICQQRQTKTNSIVEQFSSL